VCWRQRRLPLSVPYWNGARRLLTALVREGDRIRASGGTFYQFAFRRREVRAFVEAHGFWVTRFNRTIQRGMWRKRFKGLAAELGVSEPLASAVSPTRSRGTPR
jgi:hypothetical protein